MLLTQELRDFYAKNGFGELLGKRPLTVPVYTGCMLVPMPNIETRRIYLKYHDLHHLIGQYSVGRIGEGEVSAWELGTGSIWASPLLAIMNLIALSTGLILQPQRMWRAFIRGHHSKNLYAPSIRARVDAGQWPSVAHLRAAFMAPTDTATTIPVWRRAEFGFYVLCALLIHVCIAVPALIVRVFTDITLGYKFFQIIKPKKRQDLY